MRANQDRGESHDMCVCGMSLADLSRAERAMLPPPDPSELLLDRVRHNGKVGELPSAENSPSDALPNGGVHTDRATWAPPPHMGPPGLSSSRQLGSGHLGSNRSPSPLPPPLDLPPAYTRNE